MVLYSPLDLLAVKGAFIMPIMLLRVCLFHVKYFPKNTYFPEMLFSGKENIFKCLVAFQKML